MGTRLQFNQEFAKKITSHGIGAEVLGLTEERLPSKKGTFRLDIKERVLENGEPVPVGTSKRDSATGALPDNVDVFLLLRYCRHQANDCRWRMFSDLWFM